MTRIIKKVALRSYRDSRGVLVENTFKEIMDESQHFFVSKSKPGEIRGNHYHQRKSEWFYLIQGKCYIQAVDLQTKQKQEITLRDGQNIIINVKPNVAHAFKNIGSNEMILLALVSEVHNQSDPDTYIYKLL